MRKRDLQFDLFAKRDNAETGAAGAASCFHLPCPDSLEDEEVLDRLPDAGLSDVQPLCHLVAERRLGDRALPALERLWRRFAGFGHERLLLEQKTVLETLAKLDTGKARDLLASIVTGRDFPRPLQLTALRAARAALLSEFSGPETAALKDCLSDPEQAVRKAAAIVMGKLGYVGAKAILLNELCRCPSDAIIDALSGIVDEEVAVHLGRCANAHPELAERIMLELEDMEIPISRKIAHRIHTNLRQDGHLNGFDARQTDDG